MAMAEAQRLLSVRDVVKRLDVHENTVLRWLQRGELRGYRLGGTRAGWRIDARDLDEFLRRRANVPPESDRAE